MSHVKISLVISLEKHKQCGQCWFEDVHATKNYKGCPGITCDLITVD